MDVPITELRKLDVTRVDAVDNPANGFPVLIMKAAEPAAKAGHAPMTGTHSHPHPAFGAQDDDETHEHEHSHDGDADHRHSHAAKSFDREATKALVRGIIAKAAGADGEVDEEPDVAGGTEVLAQIARLIIAEAQELEAGQAGEICDIQQLACAAEMIWCWRTGEEAVATGSVMPATTLMQSAWEYPADEVAKDSREFSAAERKKHAAEGNALPDGSYPIPDKDALRRAAILARSGHGDVPAAKKLIARRAKELGVANPLDDDSGASKSQVAREGTDVDTESGSAEQVAKLGEDVAGLTKALAASRERETALEAELAKVKATPVPGGPMMTAVASRKTTDDSDKAAVKAIEYDWWADHVSDPSAADDYRKLAARERAKITAG